MADLVVSQKVVLVRSWTEDVVTDDILSDIAAHAKADKGRKLKIRINGAGIRLSRVRLLQGSETKFFPIKIVQTVMQIEDFPKCVIIILSEQEKKYKIVALRCASEADAVKLTTAFAAIQNKAQSENMELKKRDNGNWTLRGRTDHNANRVLQEMFSEHKQSNGDLRVVKTNGDVSHVQVIDASGSYRNAGHAEGVSVTQDRDVIKTKVDKKSDSEDDDYVIETEVTTEAYIPAKIHAHHETAEMRNLTTRVESATIEDAAHEHGWVSGKPHHFSKAYTLPSRPVIHKATSSGVVLPQPVVYETTARSGAPSQPVVYASTSKYLDSPQPVMYGTSSRSLVVPSEHAVYASTSTKVVHPQPDGYSISSRSYQSANPLISTSSAGYYTDPWAHRRISRESSLVPFRVDGNPSAVKFDQQSMMSNTSRVSRFSRMRSSEISIPMTVHRSIETVYPRPVVFLRQSRGHGYRPRPASYHAPELRIFQEDDREAGFRL